MHPSIRRNPVSNAALFQMQPCTRCDPVLGVTLSQMRPCPRWEPFPREAYAEEKCNIIKSHVFKSCHFISPEQFYDQCRQEVCSCSDLKSCLCSALANYAHICLLYGVYIDFRTTVHECSLNCTGDMIYAVANYTCAGSCYHLMTRRSCHFLPSSSYIEGCRCPENMFYNPLSHTCSATIMGCPCYLNGLAYNPGDRIPSPAPMKYQDCVCNAGEVRCTQLLDYWKEKCTKNEVYINCMKSDVRKRCELSCEHLNSRHRPCPFTCQEGCMCKPGLVRSPEGMCINKTECPCKYGGQLYFPREIFLRGCDVCLQVDRLLLLTCELNTQVRRHRD
ncbi:mucin-6-like [Narcine bancroftii]|uniref:mucin-6-like n=1 Tax=Narcine bancroftii TaxID=1343680 RepID=UPI00383118A6